MRYEQIPTNFISNVAAYILELVENTRQKPNLAVRVVNDVVNGLVDVLSEFMGEFSVLIFGWKHVQNL